MSHPFLLHTATLKPGPPGTCVWPSSICSGSMADPASHNPRKPVLENKKNRELPGRFQHEDARMESSPAPDPAPHPHLGAGAPGAVEEQGGTVQDRAPASGPEAPHLSQEPRRSGKGGKGADYPRPSRWFLRALHRATNSQHKPLQP